MPCTRQRQAGQLIICRAMPYSRRDLWVIGGSLIMTALAVVGSVHTHAVDFGVWFFGLGTVVLLLGPILRRRTTPAGGQPQNTRSRRERVEFDEREIRRYLPDGRIEAIAWDDIDEISIVTTDEGPWLDDVFWLFLNKDRSKGCAVSNYAEGFEALLPRMQHLHGFDNALVVQAMGSTTHRSFVIWKNPATRTADSPHH
jgi:hypothetical protein